MPSQAHPPPLIRHALCLHLYQPEGNLLGLLGHDPDELRRILLSYERIGRHMHKYAALARLHLALSPVLLEQLHDPHLIEACRHLADIPAILDSLRNAPGIEFVASGYRHAPLPLIPRADWDDQLSRERSQLEAQLGRVPRGYWPPAGHFVPDLIPVLRQAGYQYLLLPVERLRASDGAAPDPYRAYRLCHQESCINVVPIDHGFSSAQEHGLEAPWFADQVRDGVAQAPPATAPYLLTTWSDGENGEWFRSMDEGHGFFGRFFSPYMEFCETGEYPLRPVQLTEYLNHHPAQESISLRPDPAEARLDDTLQGYLEQVVAHYWSVLRTDASLPGQLLQQARELISAAEGSSYLLDSGRHSTTFTMLEQALQLLREASAASTADTPPLPSAALRPRVFMPTPGSTPRTPPKGGPTPRVTGNGADRSTPAPPAKARDQAQRARTAAKKNKTTRKRQP